MTKDEALPARPSLEFLKKLAKQQVVALRRQGKTTSLAAAQLTLARKYGFPSWRKLKAHVELLERAAAAVEAISSGDTKTLKRLLRQNSDLANIRVDEQRTLLHVATDWPGHFPNNMETVATLVAHGADVNAKFVGRHSETPLHRISKPSEYRQLTAPGLSPSKTRSLVGCSPPYFAFQR